MTQFRLIFMGTPDFSVPTLQALLSAGHDIACVYTQPPRPAGRGQKEQISPIHALANRHGILVRTPKSLRGEEDHLAFAALKADVAIVVAYGLILPPAVLKAPRLGCLNLHASKLPRWRGAAPIQRAIMAGDKTTAVAVMQMDEGLDTGSILAEQDIAIDPTTTAGILHDRLALDGAQLMVDTLAALYQGACQSRRQSSLGITYAKKIEKSESRIDWTKSASDVDYFIRGLSPTPGAWFDYKNDRIKILLATPISLSKPEPAGTILDDRLTIACGTGAVQPIKLQRAGRAPLDLDTFLRGFNVPQGTILR